MSRSKVSRREFLYLGAITVAGTVAAACQPQTVVVKETVEVEKEKVVKETVVVEKEVEKEVTKVVEKVVEKVVTSTPLPPPPEYMESPELVKLVSAGTLPPVEDRIPMDVLVVKPIEELGQYGGTIRTVEAGGSLQMLNWMETPVRMTLDYAAYIPNLVVSTELSSDGKTFTMHLRRGLKWSDGEPFTSADLQFYWEDLAMNDQYEVISHPWWAYRQEKPMQMEFPDDYTVIVKLAGPDFTVVQNIFGVGFWEWDPFVQPKHYLQQFHPDYTSGVDWEKFQEMDNSMTNPDFPTHNPWIVTEYAPGERTLLERNKFYWKTDPEGNQLPYVDRLESIEFADEEVRVLNVASGEVDAAWRDAGDARQIPFLREHAEEGDYRVLMWEDGCDGKFGIQINQNLVEDPWLRSLLRETQFRKALSISLDRNRVNEVMYYGLGRPQQGVTLEEYGWDMQTPEGQRILWEWVTSDMDYDPERANEMLDDLGLTTRDAEGFRARPDGSKLELIYDIYGDEAVAVIYKENFEAIGLRLTVNSVTWEVLSQRKADAEYHMAMFNEGCFNVWTYPHETYPTTDDQAWPLAGAWYMSGGNRGEPPEPGSPEERLLALYEKGMNATSDEERQQALYDTIRIHIDDGPFTMAALGELPWPVVIKNNLRNVPDWGMLGPWEMQSPGNTFPEQYFWKA